MATPRLVASAVCTGPMRSSAAATTATPADWYPPRGSGTMTHSAVTASTNNAATSAGGGGGVSTKAGRSRTHAARATPQAYVLIAVNVPAGEAVYSCGGFPLSLWRFRGRRPADERADAPLELGAVHQDVAPAALAADPDVRAESLDLPAVAAAGVRLARLHDVADVELHDGPHHRSWTRISTGAKSSVSTGTSPVRIGV